MHEIDKRIALLRLLLADLDHRISRQEDNTAQYHLQIARVVEVTVRQAGDVGQAVAAMAEVEERLAQSEVLGRHLAQLRRRATRELEALLLTRRVAEAKAQLDTLAVRRETLAQQLAALGDPPAAEAAALTSDGEEAEALRALNEEVSGEIDRLQRLILEASQRAARSVSPGP